MEYDVPSERFRKKNISLKNVYSIFVVFLYFYKAVTNGTIKVTLTHGNHKRGKKKYLLGSDQL